MKSSVLLDIGWMVLLASYGWAGALPSQTATYPGDSATAKRAFLYRGIQYQLSAGISSTNLLFAPPLYSYERSPFVRLDLFGVKPLSRRVDVRLGVAYEPVGNTDTYRVDVNDVAVTNVRLFFGNVHAVVGYQPFRMSPKVKVYVLGGLFAGRLFNYDMTTRLQPGGQVFVTKAVATYSGWNAGASLGVSGAVGLTDGTAVGLKMTYQPGLLNILTTEATAHSGIRTYTTSVGLSAFYQF